MFYAIISYHGITCATVCFQQLLPFIILPGKRERNAFHSIHINARQKKNHNTIQSVKQIAFKNSI